VEFTTADLCDAFPRLVELADPLFRNYGGVDRFAGRIETLKVHEDNALVRQALEKEGQGRVLVVDGGASLRCALLGGRLASLAHEKGWAGALINGCVRDAGELSRIPLGIRALNTSPRGAGKRGDGVQGGLLTFAGLAFSEGKYLYADRDGILLADRNLLESA
jgi:regulator of ribonuclease activity A